jgi:hypothetical protein
MDFNFPNLAKDQNLSKEVPTDEYTVSCQILGLRELKSPGILPVKKAFINFNIKSMLPPELGSAMKNIKTQPSALGPNPTINTLIAFDAPLPGDSLFCPRLSCQVYDNIYKGFGSQPLIGNFTIPIGDLMADLKEERTTELAAIRRICEALEQTINDDAVRSYSIQQNSVDISAMQEEEIKKQQEEFKQSKKKSFKAIEDEDVKQGLLANAEQKPEFVDRSGEQNSRRTSKRVTPRDLAQSKSAGGKTPTNAMKQTKIQKFNAALKKDLVSKAKEEKEAIAREEQAQRERDAAEFKAKNPKAAKNVLYPTYARDERLNVDREVNPPPNSTFIPLGFDNEPGQKKKHYRRFYPDELENVTSVMPV